MEQVYLALGTESGSDYWKLFSRSRSDCRFSALKVVWTTESVKFVVAAAENVQSRLTGGTAHRHAAQWFSLMVALTEILVSSRREVEVVVAQRSRAHRDMAPKISCKRAVAWTNTSLLQLFQNHHHNHNHHQAFHLGCTFCV